MELATGKVRYEFSGPGTVGWYAAFTPDGSAFLASRLFGGSVLAWPTAHTPESGRQPPTPLRSIEGLTPAPMAADVGATGWNVFALANGEVVLERAAGDAPRLAPHAGEGASLVTFTPGAGHVVALRSGRVTVWSMADPAPPSGQATPAPTPAR